MIGWASLGRRTRCTSSPLRGGSGSVELTTGVSDRSQPLGGVPRTATSSIEASTVAYSWVPAGRVSCSTTIEVVVVEVAVVLGGVAARAPAVGSGRATSATAAAASARAVIAAATRPSRRPGFRRIPGC